MQCCGCFPLFGNRVSTVEEDASQNGGKGEAQDNSHNQKDKKRREKKHVKRAGGQQAAPPDETDEQQNRSSSSIDSGCLDRDAALQKDEMLEAVLCLRPFIDLSSSRDVEACGVQALLKLSETSLVANALAAVSSPASDSAAGLCSAPHVDFVSALRGPSNMRIKTGLSPKTLAHIARTIGRCIDRALYPIIERGLDAPTREAGEHGSSPTIPALIRACKEALAEEAWVEEMRQFSDVPAVGLLATCVRAGLLAIGWISGCVPSMTPAGGPLPPDAAPAYLHATSNSALCFPLSALYVSSVNTCLRVLDRVRAPSLVADTEAAVWLFSTVGVLAGQGSQQDTTSSLAFYQRLPFYAMDAAAKGSLLHLYCATAALNRGGFGLPAPPLELHPRADSTDTPHATLGSLLAYVKAHSLMPTPTDYTKRRCGRCSAVPLRVDNRQRKDAGDEAESDGGGGDGDETYLASKGLREVFERAASDMTSCWGPQKVVNPYNTPASVRPRHPSTTSSATSSSSSSSSSSPASCSSVSVSAGVAGVYPKITADSLPWATLQESSSHVLITYPSQSASAVPYISEHCKLTFTGLNDLFEHEHFRIDDTLRLVCVGMGESETLTVDGIPCTQLRVKCSKVSFLTADRVGFSVSQPSAPLFNQERGSNALWFHCLTRSDDAASVCRQEKYALAGWLMAEAIANGVTLPMALPPVFFSLLQDWPDFTPTEQQLLSIGLLSVEGLKKIRALDAADLERIVELQGLPAKTTCDTYIDHLCMEVMVKQVEAQANTLVSALHSTGLRGCLVWQHTTAEELRSIVCGRQDDSMPDFYFKYEFMVSEDENFRSTEHNEVFLGIIWDLLNDGLDGGQRGSDASKWGRGCASKRRLLKFATGRRVLPPHSLQESFRLMVDTLEEDRAAEAFAALGQRLPTSHTCDNTLTLPNYAEAVLFAPASPWYALASKQPGCCITKADREGAWSLIAGSGPPDVVGEMRERITALTRSKLLQAIASTDVDD
eukprot:Rhum_TRINITY_DN14342_c13_g1::Rhum_TRINITY_DN14342_c13_g1_i1::g.81214::m.81214